MNTRKKTAFGILGVTATAALVTGGALPAMADDHDSSTDVTKTITRILGDVGITGGDVTTGAPVNVAPEVHVGDIGSGNAIGSGNELNAPLLSGNDTAVGSGNDTSVGDIGAVGVSDLLDGSVGDISGSVSDLLDSIDVSLDGMFD